MIDAAYARADAEARSAYKAGPPATAQFRKDDNAEDPHVDTHRDGPPATAQFRK